MLWPYAGMPEQIVLAEVGPWRTVWEVFSSRSGGGGSFWTSCWAGRKATTGSCGTTWSASSPAARRNSQRSTSSSRPAKRTTRRSGCDRRRMNRRGCLEETAGRASLTRTIGLIRNGESAVGTAERRSLAITTPASAACRSGLEQEGPEARALHLIGQSASGFGRPDNGNRATMQKPARFPVVPGAKLSPAARSSTGCAAYSPCHGIVSSSSATTEKLLRLPVQVISSTSIPLTSMRPCATRRGHRQTSSCELGRQQIAA